MTSSHLCTGATTWNWKRRELDDRNCQLPLTMWLLAMREALARCEGPDKIGKEEAWEDLGKRIDNQTDKRENGEDHKVSDALHISGVFLHDRSRLCAAFHGDFPCLLSPQWWAYRQLMYSVWLRLPHCRRGQAVAQVGTWLSMCSKDCIDIGTLINYWHNLQALYFFEYVICTYLRGHK